MGAFARSLVFRNRMSRTLFLVGLLLGLVAAAANASADDSHTDFLAGIKYREQGQLDLAVEFLTKARIESPAIEERDAVKAGLGAALLQAHRYAEAGPFLYETYQNSSGVLRARRAIDLGNLAYALSDRDKARRYFTEAQQTAGPDC
jgi:tetratricopeptide (TPR) repeat protein